MKRLSIKALGPLQITINERPAVGFDSDKVRALLVYLAVEAGLPHRREKLAGLLWPEYPERSARANLRRALVNLRQVIGDTDGESPLLLASRQTLQIDSTQMFDFDVCEFQSILRKQNDSQHLEKAVAIYDGDFLEGFSIADSSEYEGWVRVTRESLRGQMLSVLNSLAGHYESQGDYDNTLLYARRQLVLDPYREDAHHQVMRALAYQGQRNEAISHYNSFGELLREELDISPSEDTSDLIEAIRSGGLNREYSPHARRAIRGYELIERIGSGRYGAVYRASQPVIDRDVAIKVILPDYADRTDFIRRFETEAQIIARLEHPYIVPLYDFWREPGGAYLVMRWMRGGSLRSSLRQGPWKIDAALRLMEQVASALAAAHRQGVVHRDLRPENILLDDEANAYLSDFGLAVLTDPLLRGNNTVNNIIEGEAKRSLSYLPSEVVIGGKITPGTDIYSFGILIYELLIGKHPFSDMHERSLNHSLPSIQKQNPEYPVSLDQVIQHATATHPEERFRDPISMFSALKDALGSVSETNAKKKFFPSGIPNPYKGLRPFQESDASNFYGRESVIVRLIERLSSEGFGSRFLAVVGPSGCGKSSLVKAGLIPAIRKGALPGSEKWFVIEMTPGTNPFQEMESALLRIAMNPPQTMIGQLQDGSNGLIRAIERSLPEDRDIELLLVIDQLEELFTSNDQATLTHQFLNAIYNAATDPHTRLRVITTLRADYYDHPLQYSTFGELIRSRTEVLLPMTPRELERAIREPAQTAGVSFEKGLIAEILSEVSEQPGALPLLQYLLTELFDHREENLLTQQAYENIGGLCGALSSRAEYLFDRLNSEEKEAARQLFLRLVMIREDTEEARHRVLRSELESIGEIEYNIRLTKNELDSEGNNKSTRMVSSDFIGHVIDTFGKYRLLTFDRDPQTRQPTVQIAHEALLNAWHRLRGWLDESTADKRLQRVLINETAQWLDADRDPSFLLRGTQLDTFFAWAQDTRLALSERERAFLQASLAERKAQEAEDEARMEREHTLEQRSRRFLRTLVGVLAISTIIAFVLAGVLYRQQEIAQREIRVSTSRELAQASISSLASDPQLSLLLAIRSVENTHKLDEIVIPEAEDALHRAVQSAQPRLHRWIKGPGAGTILKIVNHPSESILATSWDRSPNRPWTEVRDKLTGKILMQLAGFLISDVWSDGDRLATIYYIDKFTARYCLWDAMSGEEISSQIISLESEAVGYDGYNYVDTSPNGEQLVFIYEDVLGQIVLTVWDLDSNTELFTRKNTGFDRIYNATFTKDGRQLITADENGMIKFFDLGRGAETRSIQAHTGLITRIRLSPDGNLLASGGIDHTIIIWDAHTGQKIATLSGDFDDTILNLAFNPQGTLLASTNMDGTIKMWDINIAPYRAPGQELYKLAGHYSNVNAVTFSPNGQYLITGGSDGQIKEWDVSPSSESITIIYEPLTMIERIGSIAINPEGDRLTIINPDGSSTVWDATTGEQLFTLSTTDSRDFINAAYSPSGEYIFGISEDGTIAVWHAEDGGILLEYKGYLDTFYTIEVSPDGKYLAVGNQQGLIHLLNLPTLLQSRDDTNADKVEISNISASTFVSDIEFSPDGSIMGATGIYPEGGGRPVKFWNSETGQKAALDLQGWGWNFISMAFSPDGKLLATTSLDDPAMIWEVENGKLLYTLTGHEDVTVKTAFSPHNSRLATVSLDGTVKIWDTATGQELFTLFGHTGPISDVVFSPDGSKLYTASLDGTVRVYLMDLDQLLALARERITRELTQEECLRYLRINHCPPSP